MKKIILMLAVVALLISGCQNDTYKPEWEMAQERVYTFSDGQSVDLWSERMYSWDEFRLADGTVLVIEDMPRSVENTSVIGTQGYESLSETAKNKIKEYFDNQGILYDINEILKMAYVKYNQDKENFSSYRVEQSTMPSKRNDRVICFLTIVGIPVDAGIYKEDRLAAYFDPNTGEQMSVWDLFKIPEEQAREWRGEDAV